MKTGQFEESDMIITRRRNDRGGLTLRLALVTMALALGACSHTEATREVTAAIPNDYRQRHPIAIEEANHAVVIFVGHARGGLSAPQRADVAGLASAWLEEGTGALHIDVPVGTPNARAAAETVREIRSLLTSAGLPRRAVMVHSYRPGDSRFLPPVRLTYSRIAAVAGPCGTWPEDLTPTLTNQRWFDNTDYYNFGCAYQRNLAAMVDNPADLEQPRSETPIYAMRRTDILDKYRRGQSTANEDPNAAKAKISNVGQ